jgi:plastocyanin domain-containing protein
MLLAAALLGLTAIFATGCDKGKPAPSGEAPATMTTAADGTREMQITVDQHGFTPSSVSAPAGQKVRLTFKRTTDEGCGQQVAFPALNLRRDLPLDKPVSVDVTVPASGSLGFQCGMGMYKGAVVVQ